MASANLDEVVKAVAAGKVQFEVRGLKNESTTASYGGTSFVHKATVVAIGDSTLARRPYYLLYSVKRLSGGDPATTRGGDAIASVFMTDGIGDLEFSGGYRSSSETWQPESIELTPLAIIPAAPLHGAAIRD